ncbi:MAG: hypothetical protein ACR2LX_04460 [Jatrophihabitans sp.]
MTRLLVEVTDFVDTARSMSRDVADPSEVASGRLTSVLLDSGSMAGDDPGGRQWARTYDQAARSSLLATQQVVNAAYTTSSIFARSGRNYAEAEAASTASAQTSLGAALANLPPDGYSSPPPSFPSAAGGSGGTPHGWGLVQHLVGYVWPNGHQDRLHRAAHAWSAAALALDRASLYAEMAPGGFASDALPESEDICIVCRGLSAHIADLASTYRALARACTELAHHLDQCHRAVISELADLLEWTAGIQAGGALLGAVTAGIAEAPAQALQLAKIAAAAKKVEELILIFTDAARLLADTLPTVAATAERIRLAMEGLASTRLAVAGVTSAKRLPVAGNTVRLAKSRETLATGR